MGILREAVHSLKRKSTESREFEKKGDAKNAIDWLALVSKLQNQPLDEKALDDVIDLAFAALKTADTGNLRKAAQRLEKLDELAKVKGYYWLARACLTEGNSEEGAFDYFEKALQATDTVKDNQGRLAAVKVAKYALDIAKAKNSEGRSDEAIENSLICQTFAYRFKDLDLEAAAELNGKAVELHAQVAYETSKADKGQAKYRVIEAAIEKVNGGKKKEIEDPFIVPVAVAKLEFASTTFWGPKVKTEFPIENLGPTVEQGGSTLRLVEKELAKDPKDERKKEIWGKLLATANVKLADAHVGLPQGGPLSKPETIRGLYEDGRKLKNYYHEKWSGELSFKIGYFYWLTYRDKAEAKLADDAFTESLKSLGNPHPQETDDVRRARQFIEKARNDQNFKNKLLEK